MLTRRARSKRLLVVALPGLVVVLLASVLVGFGGIVGAAPLQVTPTPPPTTAPPREPPANIPVYPGAKLQAVESATFDAKKATSWTYTVGGRDVTLDSVSQFYEREMPRNGWVQITSAPVEGTYPATVLIYHRPEKSGTPTPQAHHHPPMAIIAAGATNQANPNEIGFVITLVD